MHAQRLRLWVPVRLSSAAEQAVPLRGGSHSTHAPHLLGAPHVAPLRTSGTAVQREWQQLQLGQWELQHAVCRCQTSEQQSVRDAQSAVVPEGAS